MASAARVIDGDDYVLVMLYQHDGPAVLAVNADACRTRTKRMSPIRLELLVAEMRAGAAQRRLVR